MLIAEFISSPNKAFIKAERYLNEGSPSGFSEVNTTSKHTRPKSSTTSFALSQIKFNRNVLIEDIGEYKHGYVKNNCIFIHPDMLNTNELLKNANYFVEDEVIVAPTASGRTVLALTENYFIKLAYLGFLGRLIRHMNGEILRSAYEVTKQLINAANSNTLNPAFSFLREDFGRVAHIPLNDFMSDGIEFPKNINGCYEWGVLFRESRPFPYVHEEEFLIPFFSLFSNEFDPITEKATVYQDKPLLIQLFEHQNKSIEKFLLDDILFPLFSTYFEALIFAGVEFEAHAQNMLIAINKEYAIKRIVCRDFESAGRDVPVMEYMGINYVRHGDYKLNTIKRKDVGQKYPKYYINHSFMFDFKLGEYLVTPLLKLAHQHIPFEYNVLPNKIKEFNRQFIEKLPTDFFPPDWCYYENINWNKEKRSRTYIWQDNPKYR